MSVENFDITGLTDQQVVESRREHGNNALDFKKESGVFIFLKGIVKEPMVILLLVTSAIYFLIGNIGDGLFLAAAIVLVAAISLYQDSRSRQALNKLKDFSQPKCKVIRNGEVLEINSEDLVIGDRLMIEEGTIIAADGVIIHSNDFSVNESILTGESVSVYKNLEEGANQIYRGTTVVSGLAIATIEAIGNKTKWGEIGKSLESIQEEKTPLELQINNFVRGMVIAGSVVFLIVWGLNYIRSQDLLDSLLKALTLAMSILPEEIPVAFTTFMALGAYRLMKMGIVVKQMKTVETLGSATIICADKTGTLTQNTMLLTEIYALESGRIIKPTETLTKEEKDLIAVATWASEPIPFDPMEVALHDAYSNIIEEDERPNFQMVHEYPLGGVPPMMTHLFENKDGRRIIAAKGAPEALLKISQLDAAELEKVNSIIESLSKDGHRLLGVAEADFAGNNYPKTQQEFDFKFLGLVAFYDPPKENIRAVLKDFDDAGINVKIITGDNAITTAAIAQQVGFRGYEKTMNGEELMTLTDSELQKRVVDTQVFTRMFPDAKLKVINALKANNEIVAMTGDGVNDAPALKASHIGIAMGKKGTEIAKEAAFLVLLEDDLSKMVDAVAMGRKIYANLKKAIQYIISIHIPIILTVFIPLVLGWVYPNIFEPVHVILLELIMGPTCSIIYENEPMEKNTMQQKPRPFTTTFFNWRELTTSIIQGLVISIGALAVYRYAVSQGLNESSTRTMVFTVLISANIFLTLVNRSFYFSILETMKYKNNLVPLIILITIILTLLLLFVEPFTGFFKFERLPVKFHLISISAGFLFVMWYELVKLRKRMTSGMN